MNNIHYGKWDGGATGIATLSIDQGRVERAASADVVSMNYT